MKKVFRILELTREEKSFILHNPKDYPELSRIIKQQNKYNFERDINGNKLQN